jgi:PAS domain S-box-containing protein
VHPPPLAAGRPPRLVLRFAVLAGVALAVAGIAGLLVSREVAAGRAEEAVWTSARFAADELGRDDLARQALEAPATGELRAQLDELFGRVALGPNVLGVALYDREGRITFATDHSLIGTTGADGGKVQAALAGEGVRGSAELDGRKVLESYVPVRWLLSDASFPTGVLRVTTDYAPVGKEVAADARAQASVLLLALVLLYLSLFPILRRVTRRLARSEASYRTLTEQASDAIVVTDRKGTIVEANEQAYRLLGAHELVGRAFAELVDGDELRRDPLQIDEVVAGLTLLRERTFRREDGPPFVGELHAKQLGDGRILIAVRDATARKEAERVRSRLAAIVESSHDAIVGLDLEGRIVSWNAGAARIYGRTAGEALGHEVSLLAAPDDDGASRLRPSSEIDELECVHVRADGARIDVAVTISPVRDASGAVIGASLIGRDVTEERQREQELRRAQRAEGTARLAAGVAHDFSGLLTEIAGNSDLILARLPDGDALRARAERIQEAALRGSELTRQLGAFGRRPEPSPQVVDPQTVLHRLEPALRRLVHDGVRILHDVEPGLGRVQVDPRQLEQVVVGLVLNAEASMPAGGTVRVSAANVDFSRRKRTVGPDTRVEPGSYVMLAVADEGVGVGDTRLGLELATVFALVQGGGGTIGIESEPGRGTTVRVYLPRAAAPVAPVEAPAAAPSTRAAGETILVVEDEVVVRALVREILEDQGYRVVEAAGGREAVAVVEEGRSVDLVLTDVVMPELGGIELAAEVGRLRPGVPVIAMSGSAGEEQGGVVFLQKPFTHETLTRAVRDALDLQPALV